MAFLIGFLGATTVGIIGSAFAQSWGVIEATLKRMYSPPNPVLKPTTQANIRGIAADPEEAPIQVLNKGCLKIMVQLLFQLIMLMGMAVFVSFLSGGGILEQEVPEEFFAGAASAGILGFLLRWLSHNWGAMVDLYLKMVNPPTPALNRATPPNNHYVAAKPPQSPYDVVAGGCVQIILRLILQLVALGLLGLSLWGMYYYLAG